MPPATGLHRERAAAAAGALGVGVGDAEAAPVEVVVEVNHGVLQVHQAALVNHDRHAVELDQLVELLVDLWVKVELVLEAAAAAAHAQAEVNLLRHRAGGLLLPDDPLDFARRLFRYGKGHRSPFLLRTGTLS